MAYPSIASYPALRKRLGGKIVLLPELQEVNDLPCDTGSSREFLEQQEEFADLDFSTLDASEKEHGVKWTSKQGFFAPENVIERGRWVRRWLRSRPEQHIVGESQSPSSDRRAARLPSSHGS